MNNKKFKSKMYSELSKEKKDSLDIVESKEDAGDGEKLFELVYDIVNGNKKNQSFNIDTDELEWETPIPFDSYELPTFDSGIFSPTIKNMVDSVAEFTQTPVDLAAICAIGVLSTTFAKKIVTEIHEGWRESANTYTVVFMESSTRKSAVYDAITEPIYLYEKDLIEESVIRRKKRNAERLALEKRIEKLQNSYATSSDPAIIEEINDVVEELDRTPELFEPSLILDNATEESIISRLKENNERISIMSDEGDLFEKLKIKGNNHEKLDVYLKGYSGSHLRVDRISRPTERLDNPLLTICISAQPTVIQGMPAKMNNRGIIPRFLFSIPKNFMGHRDILAKPVSKETRSRYIELIKKMLNFSVEEPIVFTLDEQAKEIFLKFKAEVEVNFRKDRIFHDHLKAWGGKLCGQIARIAGLLHVSKYAESVTNMEDIPPKIDKETVASAVKLKDYFIPHVEKAFGIMKQNQLLVDAQFLLDKLLEKNALIISKQAAWQATRTKFNYADHLTRAANVLESRYYIQRIWGGKSGRKEFIHLNPILFQTVNSEPKAPSSAQTIENKEKKEGGRKNLDFPNPPKPKTNNEYNNTLNHSNNKVVKKL